MPRISSALLSDAVPLRGRPAQRMPWPEAKFLGGPLGATADFSILMKCRGSRVGSREVYGIREVCRWNLCK